MTCGRFGQLSEKHKVSSRTTNQWAAKLFQENREAFQNDAIVRLLNENVTSKLADFLLLYIGILHLGICQLLLFCFLIISTFLRPCFTAISHSWPNTKLSVKVGRKLKMVRKQWLKARVPSYFLNRWLFGHVSKLFLNNFLQFLNVKRIGGEKCYKLWDGFLTKTYWTKRAAYFTCSSNCLRSYLQWVSGP